MQNHKNRKNEFSFICNLVLQKNNNRKVALFLDTRCGNPVTSLFTCKYRKTHFPSVRLLIIETDTDLSSFHFARTVRQSNLMADNRKTQLLSKVPLPRPQTVNNTFTARSYTKTN